MNKIQLQAAWFKSANADRKRDALKQLVGKGEIKGLDKHLINAYSELAVWPIFAKISKALGLRKKLNDSNMTNGGAHGMLVPCEVDGQGIHVEFDDVFFGGGVGKWLGTKAVVDGITFAIEQEYKDAYYVPELKTYALVDSDYNEDDAKEEISAATGKPISKLEPAKVRDFRKGSKIVYVGLELFVDNIKWTIPWDANVDWNEVYAAFGQNAPDWKQYEMTAVFNVAGRDSWEVKMDHLNKEEVNELIESIKAGQIYYEVKEQK